MSPSQTVWEYVDDTASAVAANWLRQQAAAPRDIFNLYYRRADGAFWGDIVVATSPPKDYDLACGSSIPPSWDIARVRLFVHDVLISLPLIGTSPSPLYRQSDSTSLRADAA